jgi:hypothetical protein
MKAAEKEKSGMHMHRPDLEISFQISPTHLAAHGCALASSPTVSSGAEGSSRLRFEIIIIIIIKQSCQLHLSY